jgi:hypothetical protein
MRGIRGLAAGVIGAAVAAAVVACGDNGTGGSTKVDLTGNYSLVQLLLGGFIDAPGSTGTLTATADSVHANISIVSPDTSIVHDTTLTLAGSYVARNTSPKDSIYIVITGLGTIPGTFSITGAAKDTLTLGLFTPGGAFTAVWHKS